MAKKGLLCLTTSCGVLVSSAFGVFGVLLTVLETHYFVQAHRRS